MNLSPAPFHHPSSQAPEGAEAHWAEASDGVRLRVGRLASGPRGTVLILPGRTEYLEKYGMPATEFLARGYGAVAVDFRGQGLADRPLTDPAIGHVEDFTEYQRDVATLLAYAAHHDMPRPWVLLGHSMGGAIGLRAVLNGLDVTSAVFSAPMWGINMYRGVRPVAWGLGWLAHKTRLNGWVTPGMSRETYVRLADPADNWLTTDPEMIAYMRRQLEAVPGLDLGAPSVPWLYRALVECRDLRRTRDPGIPTLTVVPTRDEIVSVPDMTRQGREMIGGQVEIIDGGRHETMMETPARRKQFFDRATAFFDQHRGA
ncbi:alpha/beta hydrolase [Fluviibacterium sp. DFM31]|uniref:Alpha/beta hydrolase n=1 Tax=Meridianimarinicoccus marinus TaxID=3231483 RepID=A0ABV3L8A6_9RHOB